MCSATNAGRPATTARPSTTPSHAQALAVAEAGERREFALGLRGGGDRAADRVLGGVLERADQAQRLVARRCRRSVMSASVIRPVVTVPVLSSTIVSTLRVDSRISGPLISRPSWAPRPVPTISATGVASPSAHGQAMISTATAAVNANVADLAGAEPEAERRDGDDDHDRDEDAGDAVGEPLDRRLAGLRVGDELGDLGERGVLADLRGADDQAAAGVDGRARDVVARADLDRHRLAGQQAHVDGRVALDDDAVGGDLLARADDEVVADL